MDQGPFFGQGRARVSGPFFWRGMGLESALGPKIFAQVQLSYKYELNNMDLHYLVHRESI